MRHGDDREAGRLRRARQHHAAPSPLGDGEYALTGHKWFCSAPMCDAFLVLAQAERRPVVLPAAALAARRHAQPLPHPAAEGQARQPLQRVERDRVRRRLGAPGRARRAAACRRSSRWSTTRGSTASSAPPPACAAAVAQATHHAAHRSRLRQAAGRAAADAERARRPVRRVGGGDGDRDAARARLRRGRDDAASRRIATAVAKYWVCKRAPAHAAEALECLGGNGYVEESLMPRLYREAPLNGIWEGSGNVICLDVLRAIARSPERSRRSSPSAALAAAATAARRLDDGSPTLEPDLHEPDEAGARRVVERLALALQASLLVRHGDRRRRRRLLRLTARRRRRPRLRHAAPRRRRDRRSSSAR